MFNFKISIYTSVFVLITLRVYGVNCIINYKERETF